MTRTFSRSKPWQTRPGLLLRGRRTATKSTVRASSGVRCADAATASSKKKVANDGESPRSPYVAFEVAYRVVVSIYGSCARR